MLTIERPFRRLRANLEGFLMSKWICVSLLLVIAGARAANDDSWVEFFVKRLSQSGPGEKWRISRVSYDKTSIVRNGNIVKLTLKSGSVPQSFSSVQIDCHDKLWTEFEPAPLGTPKEARQIVPDDAFENTLFEILCMKPLS
jgi:hypothetical protein